MHTKTILISMLGGMAASELTGNPTFVTAVNVIVLGVVAGMAVTWIACQFRHKER